MQKDPVAMELQTYIITKMGKQSAGQNNEARVPINFYTSRLVDEHKRTYAYCLVIQPIIESDNADESIAAKIATESVQETAQEKLN